VVFSKRIWSWLMVVLWASQLAVGATAETPEWKSVVFFDNEIYPSYLVAVANLGTAPTNHPLIIGDANGTIGAYVRAPRRNSKVRFTIAIDELANEQSFDYILPEEGQVYMLLPSIVWNWKAVRRSKQPHAANCRFTMAVNGSKAESYNQVVTVRSINEALLGFETDYPGKEKSWVPTNFVLASYVNEDHPWIDQLLREALDAGIVDSFDGYQSKDPHQVIGQVWAIWYTLQRKGFRYSSITQTSSGNAKTFDQHVRLFQDSIKASQANCVDGTVMLASILRKVGLDAGIVTVPGHCYLVFRLSPDAPQSGLETTMIGAVDLRNQPLSKDPQDPGKQASLKNCMQAITVGTEQFEQALPHIQTQQNPQYSLTMVGDARRMFKIYPLVEND
jgi:hypothetical protein